MNAQVAIASTYFPAYARIPRKAQRKADEFIRKFQFDPKQASIHYEPIANVVNKQIRSVRIGDDYRAIVRAPETGNTFILLYIDHHDEAYRWAEGKQLEVHPATGTLQFFDVDQASAAVTSVTAPTDGARAQEDYEERRLFSDFTDEQLFIGGVPRALLPAVRALYTDLDLDKLVEHLPREAADLLTGLAAGYEYDAVLESILEAAGAKPDSVPPPSVRREQLPPPPSAGENPETPQIAEEEGNQDAQIDASLEKESSQAQFRLLDADFDLDKALAHPLDAWRVYLHPSQKKIVRARTKGPLRITGGAGTGKTVVAMHRAAWLVREVFTGPDDRILVTTFTKNLAHDIRANLGKLLEPEELTRIDVTNIDSWAFQYLREQGVSMRMASDEQQREAWNSAHDLYGVEGYDLAFCRAEWEAVIQAHGIEDESGYVRAVRHHRSIPLSRADRRKLWEVFREYRNCLNESGVSEPIDILRAARRRMEHNGATPPYRSVIVDECQDLSIEALGLIRAIAGPERANDLLLVGDAHQRIYGRPAPLSQAGINIRGRRSQELRLNYRTTAAICRWSMRTLGTEKYDDLDIGASTTKGYVSLRQGAAPEVRHFETRQDEQRFLVDSLRQLLDHGALPEEICITAREKKTLYGTYASALKEAGIDHEVLEKDPPRRSSVRLASMHRVKGLEFPIVFVVGVNDGIVPLSTRALNSEDQIVAKQAEQQERCLLYVATSRARDQLFVTSYDTKSPFLEGMESQASQPDASPPVAVPVAVPPETGEATADTPPERVSTYLDERPVSDWPLPTRMQNWLERHQISTVGGLVNVDPAQLWNEKNLGRKTIRTTRELLEQRLGKKWEELRQEGGIHDASESLGEESASLTEALERPLAALPLPVRFLTWADRVGVTTLREVVAYHPLKLVNEPKLGKGTVSLVRTFVEESLGRRWEELHRLASSGSLEQDELRWDELDEYLAPAIQAHAVGEAPLPPRLRHFAEAEGLVTIGELVRRKKASLLGAANIGRTSLKVGAEVLVQYAKEVEERRSRWERGFLAALKDYFVELDTRPRMIMARRAGLGTAAETLEEIGATLDITRERVRQIEKSTWEGICRSVAFTSFVESKCREVAPEGAVEIATLEGVAWWAGLSEEPDALDYFCGRLLDGAWHVVDVEGTRYLASVSQKDLDAARSDAKRRARRLAYPATYQTAKAEILNGCLALPEAVKQIVWEEVEELLSMDGEGVGRRAIAYGTTKDALIMAFLQQRDAPVAVAAIVDAIGPFGDLPSEAFLLARGVVGLERHFPDYRSWKDKLAPLAIQLMEENGPERQWSCKDLLPLIQEEVDLPEWLEHWHLAAILRRSEGLEYLGRLRVALPGVIEDSARIFAHNAVEKILTAESAPLTWDEIASRLRTKLDVSDIALVGILNKPPFIKVAKKTYGLVTRDLPGGLEAMSEALDELESIFERRGRGLAALFVREEVAEISAVHAQWTTEMCMSVVRGDPRFRISAGGTAAGLASWDTCRVPTRADLIRQALEKSGGRVTVSAIESRIEALYGEAPSRVQIGQMANRFGARLDGDWLVVVATNDK